MGQAPVIVPQSIDFSESHQTLLDRFEQLFSGAYEYVKQHLPENDRKATVLSNLVQAYDNTAAVVKEEASTVYVKLQEEAKAAETVTVEAGEAVADEAAGEAVKAIEYTVPTAAPATPSSASTSAPKSAPASGDATPTAK